MSGNGKLLWDIVQRRECTVVNTMDLCLGVITRSRMKGKAKEESVLDFVIVNQAMAPYVKEMEIDETKTKALTRFKKSTPVPSDHNYIRCTFEIKLEQEKKRRQEVYCLRNENDLKLFKEKTSNTNKFSRCFTDNGNIDKEGKKWLKTLLRTIHTSFKKVRITKQRKDKVQIQIDERKKIKSDINKARTASERHEMEDQLQRIEDDISENCRTKHYEKVKKQLEYITNEDGTTSNTGVWRLRKKIFPKPPEQLTGKKDKEGDLITNPEKLKEIYLDAYTERLKHRVMVPELLKLKTLREELFQQRLKLGS